MPTMTKAATMAVARKSNADVAKNIGVVLPWALCPPISGESTAAIVPTTGVFNAARTWAAFSKHAGGEMPVEKNPTPAAPHKPANDARTTSHEELPAAEIDAGRGHDASITSAAGTSSTACCASRSRSASRLNF